MNKNNNKKNKKKTNDVHYKNIYISQSTNADNKNDKNKEKKKNKQEKKPKKISKVIDTKNHNEKNKSTALIKDEKAKSLVKIKKEKDSNVISLNRKFDSKNLIYTPKLRNTFIVILIIFILLLGRIGYLQFVDGAYLTEMAYQQQAINQILSPKEVTSMILPDKL